MLPDNTLKNLMKKIVVIGPESTGKTTLTSQLAEHYKSVWVPEYAREYLLKHGTDYSFEDLLTIAKGQVALEEQYLANAGTGSSTITGPPSPLSSSLLFLDTDMYVMKVWC